MKKITHALCIIFVCFLFLRCEYESSEDYYNDIELEEPSVSLSLTNFSDGETLRKPKDINYSYSSSSKNALYEIRFYVDNNLIENSANTSGSVFLDIENLEDGNHTLKIEYYFKSGSGSLADINGTESYQIIEEFNLIVNKQIIPAEIERIENKEGSLYIYFKNYDYVNNINTSTKITLNINNSNYKSENQPIRSSYIELTEEDFELGYYKDTNSKGLLTNYKLITKGYYNENINEKEIDLTNDFQFSVTPIGFEKLKIKWSNFPLYNNINALSFSKTPGNYRSLVFLSDGTSGELTIESAVSFVGVNNYEIFFGGYIPGSYTIGGKIENINFSKLKYNPITNKIYALEIIENENNYYESKVFIHVLNSSNLSVEKSSFIANTIGNYGEINLSRDSKIILDLNKKSLLIDEINLDILETFNGEDYNVNHAKVGYRDNVIIINNANSGLSTTIDIYDVQTKQLLLSSSDTNYAFATQNAKYIALENKIYAKSEVSETYEIFYEFSFSCCDIDNMIYVEEENVFLVTINTSFGSGGITYSLNEITKEELRLSIPNVSYIDYDYQTNKLLSKDSFGLSIRSYNIKTEEMNLFEYFYSGRFLINNFLISSEGYYLKDVL